MRHNRMPYLMAAGAALLLAAGPVASAVVSAAEPAAAPVAAAPERADVDAKEAIRAALAERAGAVEGMQQDGSTWQVVVVGKDGKSRAEMVVGATGTVTETSTQTTGTDSADENESLLAARVTAAKAVDAALAAHPGQVRALRWEADDADRGPYWGIEVRDPGGQTWLLEVDATSGSVDSTPAAQSQDR